MSLAYKLGTKTASMKTANNDATNTLAGGMAGGMLGAFGGGAAGGLGGAALGGYLTEPHIGNMDDLWHAGEGVFEGIPQTPNRLSSFLHRLGSSPLGPDQAHLKPTVDSLKRWAKLLRNPKANALGVLAGGLGGLGLGAAAGGATGWTAGSLAGYASGK